jgi:hypothetical protein
MISLGIASTSAPQMLSLNIWRLRLISSRVPVSHIHDRLVYALVSIPRFSVFLAGNARISDVTMEATVVFLSHMAREALLRFLANPS